MKDTYKFYVVLACFILSYSLFLMLTSNETYLHVFKITYKLTLGELDFKELNITRFLIFFTYTILITFVLMNLLIAILSDAYELVTSEKRYYDGKAKMHRSLMYETLIEFISRPCTRDKK